MATKNMSRTVIEGGRYNRNKRDRYISNRLYRADSRRFSKAATNFIDPDELGSIPKRRVVRKEFKDKLSPMYRWLAKQIGKRWDVIFSELVRRFDTRTVAGNHVVQDHLLQNITLQPTDVWHLGRRGFRNDYYVDETGILCLHPSRVKEKKGYLYPHRYKKIQEWAADRKVMDYGVSLFWMIPETLEWVNCGHKLGYFANGKPYWSTGGIERCERKHRYVPGLEKVYDVDRIPSILREKLVRKIEVINGLRREFFYRKIEQRQCKRGSGRFFQGDRFSERDTEIWEALDTHERENLLYAGSISQK